MGYQIRKINSQQPLMSGFESLDMALDWVKRYLPTWVVEQMFAFSPSQHTYVLEEVKRDRR